MKGLRGKAAGVAFLLLWPLDAFAFRSPATLPDLQGLIDRAPSGAVLDLPPGVYHGNFRISRPVSLRGHGQVTLGGDHQGTILTVEAADVSVSGINFRDTGDILGAGDSAVIARNSPRFHLQNIEMDDVLFGLQLLNSPSSVIRDVRITGYRHELGRRGDGLKIWYSPGTRLIGNTVTRSRDVLLWYSDRSVAEGNTFVGNRYGLHFMFSHDTIAKDNRIIDNSVGIYVMYSHGLRISENQLIANRGSSGYGVALKESDRFQVLGNTIVGNRIGIQDDSSPLSPPRKSDDAGLFRDNRISRNDIGIRFIGEGRYIFLNRNDFVDNWQQSSSQGANRNLSDWQENYFSDYAGVDPRKTGFGIIPYRTNGISESITDEYEGFKIFKFGPAMLALDFSAKAIPWLAPNPKESDPRPAMHPWTRSGQRSEHLPFLFLSGGLGFVSFFFGRRLAA